AEIIGVPQIVPQRLEDLPVAALALVAARGGQRALELVDDPAVVEQRVVDVDQEHECVAHVTTLPDPSYSSCPPCPSRSSCPSSPSCPSRPGGPRVALPH